MISEHESAPDLLRGVTILLETHLPPQTIDYVWTLIEAGECVIAFEDLCTQLEEFDINIEAGLFETLRELGEYWGIPPSTYEDLRPG